MAAPVEAPVRPGQESAEEGKGYRARVLVVDDEPVVRETLVDLLRTHGFAVSSVASGEDAFGHLPAADVVLLDAMLPGQDGWTICRRIKREFDPLLPIIMVTARTTPADVVRTFEAGADDYIAKPFSVPELIARISSRLAVHRTEVALTDANRRLSELADQNYLLYEQARRDAEERSDLLRELDHRVRNNLSVMLGLVSMERARGRGRDASEALETLESRMRSFLLVHDALRRENYRGVPVREFIGRLAQRLRNGFAMDERVQLRIDSPDITVGEKQGFALALILNELLTNAFRHGFPGEARGTVSVFVTVDDDVVTLEVRDTGVGRAATANGTPGSGRSIVEALTRSELAGSFELEDTASGTTARIRFRRPVRSEAVDAAGTPDAGQATDAEDPGDDVE